MEPEVVEQHGQTAGAEQEAPDDAGRHKADGVREVENSLEDPFALAPPQSQGRHEPEADGQDHHGDGPDQRVVYVGLQRRVVEHGPVIGEPDVLGSRQAVGVGEAGQNGDDDGVAEHPDHKDQRRDYKEVGAGLAPAPRPLATTGVPRPSLGWKPPGSPPVAAGPFSYQVSHITATVPGRPGP